MSTFRPPGTLLLAEALGKAMQAWSPEAWGRLRPEAREFFDGGAPLQGFALAILNQEAGVKECYDRLRAMLSDGSLPSRLRGRSGIVPLDLSFWSGRDADRLSDVLVGLVRPAGSDSAGDVLIQAEDLDAVLAGRSAARSKLTAGPVYAPVPTRNPGGKPPRHDLARFLGIAARIHYDQDPATLAELRRLALDAYSATLPAGAEPPSDEWAKPHIRAFREGYDAGGKRSV